jgi:hypothetical protein
MPYPDRVVYDLSKAPGQQRTTVPVDDIWVLGNKPNTLSLISDKAQIAANGQDTATVTIQLQSPRMADDSHDNIAEDVSVVLLVNDEKTEAIDLIAGVGVLTLKSVEPGQLIVRGETYESPEPVTIQVV